MRFVKVLFFLALLVFSVLFFTQNNDVLMQSLQLRLEIPYGPTMHSVPLTFSFLILLAFAIGCVFAVLYFAVDKLRAASKLKECKTRMASLEQELNSLRNMPISEDQPYGASEEKKEEEEA